MNKETDLNTATFPMLPEPMTKREHAASAIRRAIHNGRYQPGEVISQKRLSDDLGLSLTPLREAIIQLGATGLIERHSHHSIKVREIDAAHLTQIYQVRTLLELEAVRLAVRNATTGLIGELQQINAQLRSLVDSADFDRIDALDRQFHHALFSACKNKPLVEAIEFAKSSFSFYALWNRPGRLAVSVVEHEAVISALEARDLHTVVRLHEEHLQRGLAAALAEAFNAGTETPAAA